MIILKRSIRDKKGKYLGCLYYHEGNFYRPLMLPREEAGRVSRLIKIFLTKYKDRVKADRASPEYKTLVELFDIQLGVVDE